MTFKVLFHPRVFDKIPAEMRDQIKEALKELKDPLPGGNKKEVKGIQKLFTGLGLEIFGQCIPLIFQISIA